MITNYLSFCSGSFYCMPFNSRHCSRPIHRLNHRSKPFVQSVHCLRPKLADLLKYRKSWFSLGTLQCTIKIRIAREYLIRVCTCNVGFLGKANFSFQACSVFSVFRALLVPQMLNIYTMLKLRPLVYVLQVGRAQPVPSNFCRCSLGSCTCKVRNTLTLVSLFSR